MSDHQSQKVSRASARFLTVRTSLKDFTVPWARLCAAYPGTEISAATLTVYYERLCKYDVERITEAFNQAIDRCTFFPRVAEIIEIIERLPVYVTHKLLDAPRPNKQEIEKNRAALREMIDSFLSRRERKTS